MRMSNDNPMPKCFLLLAILVCFAFVSMYPVLPAQAYSTINDVQCLDLDGSEWYFDYAQLSLELGLFDRIDQRFCGEKYMTYDECSQLVTKLCHDILGIHINSAFYTNKNYLHGQLMNRENYIDILTSAISDDMFPEINEIASVTGVQDKVEIGKKITMLYRAGVLVGDGSLGYFSPFRPLTRAEAAVIAVRVIFPEKRIHGKYVQKPDPNIKIKKINLSEEYAELFNEYPTRLHYCDGLIYFEGTEQPDNRMAMSIYFNSDGQFILEPTEDYFYYKMQDGMIIAQDRNKIYHIFNRLGEYVKTEQPILSMTQYAEGLAAVKYDLDKDAPAYIINKEGKTLKQLPGGYYLCQIHPSDGILTVSAEEYSGITAVVSIETGEIKTPDEEYYLSGYLYGLAYMAKYEYDEERDRNNMVENYLVDKELQVVIPNEYDYCDPLNDLYIWVTKDNKCGVINYNNEIVVPIEYTNIIYNYLENKNMMGLVFDGMNGNNYIVYSINKNIETEEIVSVTYTGVIYDRLSLSAYKGPNRIGVLEWYSYITDIYGNCLITTDIHDSIVSLYNDYMPENPANREIIFRTEEGYFAFTYDG